MTVSLPERPLPEDRRLPIAKTKAGSSISLRVFAALLLVVTSSSCGKRSFTKVPLAKGTRAGSAERSPELQKAKGRTIKDKNHGDLIVWDNIAELPFLDNVFPSVRNIPDRADFPNAVAQIALPETDERRRLKRNVVDDIRDKLYAVKSIYHSCAVEIFGGTSKSGMRGDWIRGVDPVTDNVIWTYHDPSLAEPSAGLDFPMQSDNFILTDVLAEDPVPGGPARWAVKLFSCREGFLRTLPVSDNADAVASPVGRISPDGRYILTRYRDRLTLFDVNSDEIWSRRIGNKVGVLFTPNNRTVLAFSVDREYQEKDSCCAEISLLDLKTGGEAWRHRFLANLGDRRRTFINTSLQVAKTGSVFGLWLMDYSYIQFLEKSKSEPTNPYTNLAFLFTQKGDSYGFRLDSIGFSFSLSGRYLFANGKFYDVSMLLEE